jgi:predicted transcriptional regulator
LESLPEDSREFLEEYIDSIHSSDAASQLKHMLERVGGSSGLSAATLEAIGVRVIVLLWALQSQKWDLCGMSQSEIARKIGKTKADVSPWVKRNEEEFGIHARGQKMLESSKVYKVSAKAGWSTRREKNPEKMTESERRKALTKLTKQMKTEKPCN